MNSQERTNIIMDIINYHRNSENSEFESQSQIIKRLSKISDKQLYITWDISVGQFVDNLDMWNSDEYKVNGEEVWRDRGYSTVWDWQFYKVKRTGSPDYNFENPVYEKPYTEHSLKTD
jgi:hypothetical protein